MPITSFSQLSQLAIYAGGQGSGRYPKGSGGKQTYTHDAPTTDPRPLLKEWNETYPDKDDHNPLNTPDERLDDGLIYHATRDQNGKLVAAAQLENMGKEEWAPDDPDAYWIHDIRSHAPGAGKALVEHLKTRYENMAADAETDAGEQLMKKSGFKEEGEGQVGTQYYWRKDGKENPQPPDN